MTTRREFLKGSGALVVTFSMEGVGRLVTAASAAQFNGPGNNTLDAWLAIAADGAVTAFTGKCEIGQGLYTAQTQLIAEELRVPLDRVTLVQCDTARTPDQGTTSGSQSHPTNFNRSNLALAAATAREALLRLASRQFALAVDQLEASEGAVRVKTNPGRRATYGELVGGRRFEIPLDRGATRRPPASWTVLGQPVRRLDMPALATGRFEFVHNIRLPGMLHGAVVRPPSVGATLASVDEGSVREIPGIVKVVARNNFVGIVAEKRWQAIRAADALKAAWTRGARLPAQRGFYESIRKQPSRDTLVVDSGNVDQALRQSARIVTATYLHPYQMHGSIGTSCAVADVRRDDATIWSATQAVYPLRNTLAKILGFPAERVRVIFKTGSGCYGINGADTVSYDAAILSQAVGRPVRVQLARREEMAWENYGFAYVIDQRVGVDATGRISVWDYEAWFPSLGGRPGYDSPGNVITGMLAGFEPSVPAPRSPAPAPGGGFNNGSNAVPSYVAGCVAGRCGGTGTVATERVLVHNVRSPFWTGPLRSPSRLQNTFAHESLMDEVAAIVKADPIEFRLRHLADPRLIEVVKTTARAANWQTRSSPRGRTSGAVAIGRGFACVLYEGDNGYSALVADVEVNQGTGQIVVKRLVVGSDCGPISNPDGLRNQIEGGALQGMSRALMEEVTWDDERVTSIDWRTYRTLPLGFEVPVVESVLINRSDVPATGAGETAITVVAAAIGNAIFDATGARIREVPFTPDRVKRALDAARDLP